MGSRAQEAGLVGVGEQEQILDQPLHAIDLGARDPLHAPDLVGVRILLHGQDLELAAEDRQRRPQLVRGVGQERVLPSERLLQRVEHLVERPGQDADLVVAAAELHPRTEVALLDPPGHARHPAQRRRHAGRDEPASQERAEHAEHAGQEERLLHGVLGALDRLGGLGDAEAHGPAVPRAPS